MSAARSGEVSVAVTSINTVSVGAEAFTWPANCPAGMPSVLPTSSSTRSLEITCTYDFTRFWAKVDPWASSPVVLISPDATNSCAVA